MPTEKSITEKNEELIDRNARFRFLIGRKAGKEVPIKREAFFIGRGPNNNLILEDRSVSRKHAVLNYMDGRFILSDLKSTKGVIVNGQKAGEIDAYIPPNTHDNALWHVIGLSSGEHTVRVVTRGDRDARSGGTEVVLERAVVFGR